GSTEPGFAEAFNEDGTPNSSSRPARLGSIVTFYATGLGDVMPRPPDGWIVVSGEIRPKLQVAVEVDRRTAEILELTASGSVAGLFKIPALLLPAFPPPQTSVTLRVHPAEPPRRRSSPSTDIRTGHAALIYATPTGALGAQQDRVVVPADTK